MKNTSIINVGVLKKITWPRTSVMFPITSSFDLDWFDTLTQRQVPCYMLYVKTWTFQQVYEAITMKANKFGSNLMTFNR
jgi:hypothetical protein